MNDMTVYRNKIMQEYRDNKHLKLTEDEVHHISHFPIDPDYHVDCTYELSKEKEKVAIQTYAETEKIYSVYGIAHCSVKGEPIALYLYQSTRPHIPKDYLFLPIMDLTNGEATYGGGRYIEMSTSDIKDNHITIDFNKLYNPYCAFRDGFYCPIPPKENHLNIALPVGEKAFSKH